MRALVAMAASYLLVVPSGLALYPTKVVAAAPATQSAAAPQLLAEELQAAINLRDEGHYLLARRRLEDLLLAAGTNASLQDPIALAIAITDNRRLDTTSAAPVLQRLLDSDVPGVVRRAKLELAQTLVLQGDTIAARRLIEPLAAEAADSDDAIAHQAALLAVRLQPAPERAAALRAWWSAAQSLPDSSRAPLALAALRSVMQLDPTATDIGALITALRQAASSGGSGQRHAAELAELVSELDAAGPDTIAAMRSTRAALGLVERSSAAVDDLRYRLEWRLAQLARRQGEADAALAALQRAVEALERLRIDLPITYPNGQSSFSQTLQPVYTALADQLLQRAAQRHGAARQRDLLAARRVAELLKQSELQDYLGERCATSTADAVTLERAPAGTAILYPIILADRTELLLQTAAGVDSRTLWLGADNLRVLVTRLALAQRNADPTHLGQAQALYRSLLGEWAEQLSAQQIDTLLVVPDGSLRMLPWAALHDGERYLGERVAVATLSGLRVSSAGAHTQRPSLVSGLAVPGNVVARLGTLATTSGLAPDPQRALRTVVTHRIRSIEVPAPGADAAALQDLRERLSLPGVRDEVEELAERLRVKPLLDGAFTRSGIATAFSEADHGTVHIATHGFFGRSGAESFLMAHDDLLGMADLERLLRPGGALSQPVGLVTLSACETAEGDERSPLGIAGVAIKAQAASVLGTLWPVSDEAAKRLMSVFYTELLSGTGKAEALRRAQSALIAQADTAHPFFWAPFIVIGDWR